MEAIVPSIRPAAVAGLFYPGDGKTLAAAVRDMLEHVTQAPLSPCPKALIVPHAGYIYSGPIAASAYALLAVRRTEIRRVVLLGPSHHAAFHGMALPRCTGFATPLGTVPVDIDTVDRLAQQPDMLLDDRPHAREHSLEVQLPFLQSVLDEFSIVPLCLGMVDPAVAADLLETLWGGPETLIIVSSDLSHYHSYAIAKDIDRRSLEQIRAFGPQLAPEQACGCTGINALLLAASQHGLIPVIRDFRNSGDTAGDQSRVVGYAAVSFLPAAESLH